MSNQLGNGTITFHSLIMQSTLCDNTIFMHKRHCNRYSMLLIPPLGYNHSMGLWWIGIVWHCGIYVESSDYVR